MQFATKTAIVTGAASGIGAATATMLAKRGARVTLIDLDPGGLGHVAGTIRAGGGEAHEIACDVADPDAAPRAIDETRERWGRVDCLALCAGITTAGGGTAATLDDAQWQRMFDINVMGTVRWVRAALPDMTRAGGGSIVTLTSQLAFNSGGNNCAYITMKGALVAFTKTTAVDFARQGVRINAVAPAVIDTPMARNSLERSSDPEALMAWRLGRTPMGRLGRAEEVAGAITFLLSDDASYTTGTVHFVDGGWTVG